MKTESKDVLREETLDPEDWESMRKLGHKMIDDILDFLKTLRDRPVWQPVPDQIRENFKKPLPQDPQRPEEIYKEFLEKVLPYHTGNIHPRFWGWAMGTGNITGAFAEMLAASMNTNAGGGENFDSAFHVEVQVIDWIKQMLGFPSSASGLLTTGGSSSNLIGLTVARNTKAGYDLRKKGLQNTSQKMTLYASQEAHSSIRKDVELLGLGSDALRQVPVNDDFQIDIQELENTIKKDRQNGYTPFCVVGGAGTINTGAVDDLKALADICQRQNLWLHVDGAFGAWAALAPKTKTKVTGMERADSLALDLHKLMYMPFEIGCILIRNEEYHRKTFSLTPEYLARGHGNRGIAAGDSPWRSDYGFQLTRNFKALKAWMSIKEHGSRKYARLIQQSMDQAQYLAHLIESQQELQLSAPVTLNVVCFRYIVPHVNDAALDELNKQMVIELQEQGNFVLSGTTIKSKYVMRAGIMNHRSRRKDFDALIREVISVGKKLASSTKNASP